MLLPLLLLDGLETSELVIIFLIGLLLFGGRLPEVGRSLGRTISKFKNSMKEFSPEVEQARAQMHEVTRGIRDAADGIRHDVEHAIESDPRRSASPSPSNDPYPATPVVETHDPWLGTEVAPGYVEDHVPPSTPAIGPTGAIGIPSTESTVRPRGPTTPAPESTA